MSAWSCTRCRSSPSGRARPRRSGQRTATPARTPSRPPLPRAPVRARSAAGSAANDGVVDQDDALPFEKCAHGIELQPDAEIADGLLRLDKRAADIVIANQAHAKGQSGFKGVADGCGHAGIRDRHDEIGLRGLFARQQTAEHLPAAIDRPSKDQAIWAREIDVFEDAELMLFFWSEAQGFDAAAGDAH